MRLALPLRHHGCSCCHCLVDVDGFSDDVASLEKDGLGMTLGDEVSS